MVGNTLSHDFPTTSGSVQAEAPNLGRHGFVSKIGTGGGDPPPDPDPDPDPPPDLGFNLYFHLSKSPDGGSDPGSLSRPSVEPGG